MAISSLLANVTKLWISFPLLSKQFFFSIGSYPSPVTGKTYLWISKPLLSVLSFIWLPYPHWLKMLLICDLQSFSKQKILFSQLDVISPQIARITWLWISNPLISKDFFFLSWLPYAHWLPVTLSCGSHSLFKLKNFLSFWRHTFTDCQRNWLWISNPLFRKDFFFFFAALHSLVEIES